MQSAPTNVIVSAIAFDPSHFQRHDIAKALNVGGEFHHRGRCLKDGSYKLFATWCSFCSLRRR